MCNEKPKETVWGRFSQKLVCLDKIANYINVVAIAVFFGMIAVTFVDVFARYVMHNAFPGMKEITEVMLFLMIGLTIPAALANGNHIVVSLVTDRLKPTARALVSIFSRIVLFAFFIFLCYSSVEQFKLYFTRTQTHGAIMAIVLWPFIIAVTIAFFLTMLISFRNVISAIDTAIRENAKALQYVLTFVVTAGLLVFLWLLMTKVIVLNTSVLCIGAIILMLVLMFLGVPVGYSLWFLGVVIIGNIRGITTATAQLSGLNLQVTTNYTWSVVTFFLLMGMLCFTAGFGKDIFHCFQMFLSRMRGGVCVVTIAASAALAAVVGDNTAVVSTMSTVAYPEMKKLKYNDKLSMGTLAAGSCLGPLIPPSTGFITYSLLTLVSLGKLFASGIIPGILLAIAFVVTIQIICRRHPEYGPRGEGHTWKEKVSSLPGALPIIILFIFVIGGTMIGAFSSTEAGAMGCVGALIIGLIMRRFSFKTLIEAFSRAGGLSGMIFTVIVGAKVFSTGLGWCNLNQIIGGFFQNLNLSAGATVAIILLFFFVAGFFIDILPLMFVVIPIVFPIIAGLGVNGVWFGCLLVIIINSGVISPPFATILFVMRGLMPEVKMTDIYKGVIPFLVATIVVVGVLFFVPQLVMFLPNMIG